MGLCSYRIMSSHCWWKINKRKITTMIKKIAQHGYKHLLILFVSLILISFFYFQLYQYLTIESLSRYQHDLQLWTNEYYYSAVTLYILIFVALITCAIPCATFL